MPSHPALAAAAALAALLALAARGQGRAPLLDSPAACRAAAAHALSRDFHSRGVRLGSGADDFARDNPAFCRNALVAGDGWPPPGLLHRIVDGPVYVYVDYGPWRDSAPPERGGMIVLVTRWGYVGSPD